MLMIPNRLLLATATAAIAISDPPIASAQSSLAAAVAAVDSAVRTWRRDFHRHPELSNREARTSARVAQILRGFGLEVRTGVARTGVVALLKGVRPGATIAYRADMDATIGLEDNDLPFKSTSTDTVMGREVPVAHLCGHDAHTAMLLGVAQVLSGMRSRLAGNIVFIFQPAEEGHVPPGEAFGARLMLQENVLGLFGTGYRPEAIFGLHVLPRETGTVTFREKSLLGSSGEFDLTLKQAAAAVRGHDIREGVPADPAAVMAEIILALKHSPEWSQEAFAPKPRVSVRRIETRSADGRSGDLTVHMTVGVRIYDRNVYQRVLGWIRDTVQAISAAAGVAAELTFSPYAPVLYNDPELVRLLRPIIAGAIGEPRLVEDYYFFPASDDVALFQEEIPGIFMFLGVNREGMRTGEAPSNHTPKFLVNEDAFQVGMLAMASIGAGYLAARAR